MINSSRPSLIVPKRRIPSSVFNCDNDEVWQLTREAELVVQRNSGVVADQLAGVAEDIKGDLVAVSVG